MTTTTAGPLGNPIDSRDELRIEPAYWEIRDAEVNGKLSMLSGIAVPYGQVANIGWFDESFRAGSFAKSIKESARSLPLLGFHEHTALPVGVAKEWHEETAGLRGVWRLEDHPAAQQLARMAVPDADGHASMGYLSVRFQPIKSEWSYAANPNDPEARDSVVRTEARLLEVSMVSTPAYASAAVQWVRTADPALRGEARGARLAGYDAMIERMRTDAPTRL